jgi:hypothetical protein
VYVPRKTQGQYDYMKEPMKIALSSRSPQRKEVGEHIENLPPTLKKEVLEYFKMKGYKQGHSEFKAESADYTLKDNERWAGKAVDGLRDIEVMVKEGLCNRYQDRDELNIIYYLDLQKALPQWPWPCKLKSAEDKGFGL